MNMSTSWYIAHVKYCSRYSAIVDNFQHLTFTNTARTICWLLWYTRLQQCRMFTRQQNKQIHNLKKLRSGKKIYVSRTMLKWVESSTPWRKPLSIVHIFAQILTAYVKALLSLTTVQQYALLHLCAPKHYCAKITTLKYLLTIVNRMCVTVACNTEHAEFCATVSIEFYATVSTATAQTHVCWSPSIIFWCVTTPRAERSGAECDLQNVESRTDQSSVYPWWISRKKVGLVEEIAHSLALLPSQCRLCLAQVWKYFICVCVGFRKLGHVQESPMSEWKGQDQ